MRTLVISSLCVLLSSGCHHASPPLLESIGARIAERIPTDLPSKQPETKRRFNEAVTYIDDKTVGVVKYTEIPVKLTRKPRLMPPDFPVFPLAEYLQRVGADLEKIKQVHLYSGRRVSIIDKKKLIKARERLIFAFSQGENGDKPRMEWPNPNVKTNTQIDTLTAIAIYENKEPPTLHAQEYVGSFLTFANGTPLENIPYTPKKNVFKSTRVYINNRLATAMKQKMIPDQFLIENSDVKKPRFHLMKYLESLNISFDSAKTIDFIDSDHTIARFEPAW